ncbi:TPA: type I restriction endonuclease subunit R, EcoR124 family, partial [Streptococcus suis]
LAPERISKVVEHILSVYPVKTHREVSHIVKIKNVDGDTLRKQRMRGYNAMLAVQNVYAAKMYYEELHNQQASIPEECRLRIGMIYSFAANEEQAAYGDIYDEDFNPSAMESSAKEFLDRVIADYNKSFSTSFSTESQSFQNYYKDLSQRTKNKEIDLLIVVGMFLTGFDAPTMNTLFVDKNLRYHGLIQAYSRTNRILSKDKPFGNIVCFRDLEKATIDALKLFGEDNNIYITLEKSYQEYMEGFEDEETGVIVRGYKEVCREMLTKFPDPTEIYLESEKKEFVGLFGELLKLDNVLRNFDEFTDEERLISQGLMQDYRSKYVDIREESYHSGGRDGHQPEIDLSDLEFEIELLKSDEINLDYIIALISEKANEDITKEQLQNQVSRVIRSTIDMRAKERLVMDFIRDSNLDELKDNQTILEAFYHYARKSKQKQIELFAQTQQLQGDYKLFIEAAILRGFASTAGTDLNALMPPTSRRQGAREKKKQEILHQLQELVETFTGI